MVDRSKGTAVAFSPEAVAMAANLNQAPGAPGGIVRGDGADWFGPLNPLSPTAPLDVTGRQLDFPSGYNLNVYPKAYEGLPFPLLRSLADSYDVLRAVIETRKDQVSRLKWRIVPRDQEMPAAGTAAISSKPDPRAVQASAFFRRPNRRNTWAEWLRMLLEDMFVLDAATLYRRPTRAGALYSLDPIDGATIKRVIDDWGRTPEEPAPAYQQILKGLPAVNYTLGQMYYKPRNPRTSRVYGYGPVEQIVMTVNIALRRQYSTLQYFTEGNIPEALIGVPDSWTPDQIKQFQEWWDSILAGDTGERRHAKFVPAGVGKTYIETRDPDLKGVFDEWLARIVCFAFNVPPTPFVAQNNRATAESAKEQSLEEGLVPIQEWVKSIVDDSLEQDFGWPDLEFQWQEDDETDPETAAKIVDLNVKNGTASIDEQRVARGQQPFGGVASTPMVLTVNGYVPLTAYEDTQKRMAQQDEAAQAAALEAAKNPQPAPSDGASEARDGKAPAPKGEGVGKAAGAPFAKAKRLKGAPGPIPYPRKATRTAQRAMEKDWREALDSQKAEAVAAAGAFSIDALRGAAGMADSTAIGRVIAALELAAPALETLAGQYTDVATDSGELAYAQIGSTEDVFQQVNKPAAAWAADRSAALVSGVDETTRAQLQAAIAAGIEAGETNDQIAARIEALGAFGPDRAKLIAYTEIAAANSQGALNGYRAARDEGLVVKKEWILGEHACDECLDNADAGAIGLDEAFPSGDDAPPAHPNCECSLSPVVEDAAESE